MPELIFILIIVLLIWLWRDSARTRELAIAAARSACGRVGAQFLDETVMLAKVRLCRKPTGNMALCRVYSFDFSLDGAHRRSGTIVMNAQSVKDLVLDLDQVSTLQ